MARPNAITFYGVAMDNLQQLVEDCRKFGEVVQTSPTSLGSGPPGRQNGDNYLVRFTSSEDAERAASELSKIYTLSMSVSPVDEVTGDALSQEEKSLKDGTADPRGRKMPLNAVMTQPPAMPPPFVVKPHMPVLPVWMAPQPFDPQGNDEVLLTNLTADICLNDIMYALRPYGAIHASPLQPMLTGAGPNTPCFSIVKFWSGDAVSQLLAYKRGMLLDGRWIPLRRPT